MGRAGQGKGPLDEKKVHAYVAVPTDEIFEKYLQKAIAEINELGDEIARAAGGSAVDRKSTRLNSSHSAKSRMPSSA